MTTENTDITVIVVSDFEASETKTWADEIKMAEALAAQDIAHKFDVVFVENEANRGALPAALLKALPNARVDFAPFADSARLKDFAVARCATPWVSVLEADALPEPQWLRLHHEAALANPEYDAFSGRTHYGDETSWRRALNLLDRSFDDIGVSGPSAHISNNGALIRTSVLKNFPYPEAETPFLSARRRIDLLADAGYKFYSVRDARMRHAVGGVDFVRDFRRNTGFGDMKMSAAPSMSKAPAITAERMKGELGAALRLGGDYLKIIDWPLWLVLFAYVRVPEWRGMREAVADKQTLEGSAYR